MRSQKYHSCFLLLACTMLVITTLACGSIPTSVSEGSSADTDNPTSANSTTPTNVPETSTPTPDTSPTPNTGYWANEEPEPGEARVSFELSDDGSISNFEMTASVGVPTQTCMIAVDKLEMQVNSDGTFEISYLMEYEDVEAELGAAVLSLIQLPEGEPYEGLHISGDTTDTMMTGTFTISVCNHALFLSENTGSWKAEWKNL